jgi:hypothetical protein
MTDLAPLPVGDNPNQTQELEKENREIIQE